MTTQHYLAAIMLDSEVCLHGYFMCPTDTKGMAEYIGRMMMDNAEKACEETGARPPVPLLTLTLLDDSVVEVREIMCRRDPRIKDMLAQAKNHNVTIWIMPTDDPDHKKLMDLH